MSGHLWAKGPHDSYYMCTECGAISIPGDPKPPVDAKVRYDAYEHDWYPVRKEEPGDITCEELVALQSVEDA